MVIDRTTGKGCALSIAAKTVTRNLIADGIIGKTIAKKERPKRSVWLRVRDYGDDWVCIGGNIAHELTEEPLWVPSFIDERIWTQAVSKFHIDSRLDENVVEFLLPEMDEYLQNIPDSELISITRDFLIENGILDQPIRRHKGNTYYFDKSEIYSLDNESKLFPYEGRINHIFTVTGPDAAFFNSGVWIKAAPRFEVGMSLKECIGIFVETELAHRTPQKLSPLDQLIQYIARPVYERVPGNDNVKTFDRIRITVGLPRYQFNSWEALQSEVKKYQHEIYQRVIQRMETDRSFKRYGVPINFLEISDVTLLRDFSLEFIFELKVYGDNVFEKDGIRRDRTGDGEKTRCLCGKRGIFNRDGPAMGPQIIRQLERRASRRSASFFHALASPGRPRNGGGASGAYQPAEGRKP